MHTKVMVWAGLSVEGAIRLAIIDTFVYQDIFRTHLLLFLEKMPNHRFQQDNASFQRSVSTKGFFEEHEITLFETPPESPDLNPIENIWHEHFLVA